MSNQPELSLDNPHDINRAPSKLPRGLQIAMIVVLVLAVAVSGYFAATEHWRRATFTLGSAMIWLAIIRLTCDSKIVGVLAVRSVRFDVAYTTILGSAMVFLATSVDSLGS